MTDCHRLRHRPQRPPFDSDPGQSLGIMFVYLVLGVFIAVIVILGVASIWHRPMPH